MRTHTRIGAIFLLNALAGLSAVQNPPGKVVLNGRTLFTIQQGLGPFTAQERANHASARLASAAGDLTATVNQISAVNQETSTDILMGDRILATVTDADAKAAGTTRTALAGSYLAIIREAISDARSEYSLRSLLKGAAFVFLDTALLILVLALLRKAASAALARLGQWQIAPIRIQNLELASPTQIRRVASRVVGISRWALILLALYIYLPVVLSLFPWTRSYAPVLFEYVARPLESAGAATAAYIPSLLVVVLCAAGARILIRISQFLFRELATGTISLPGFYPEWASPTHKIIRFLILAFTAVVIFPYLPGSGSPAFRGISLFLGLLFSLGSTSAVANIVAGVILTYSRALDIGDHVKIGDTVGDVVEKTLLATRIRTVKNEVITVPNSMVMSSHIINFSSSQQTAPLILHTSVTIGYDAPWRTVHRLLLEAAGRTSRIAQDPAPFVLQTSLNDFYVTYQINAYTREASKMAHTYGELHQNIQDCFNAAGVEIMSPHYASLRDGNRIAIPTENLPKDYRAPGFHLELGPDPAGPTPQR